MRIANLLLLATLLLIGVPLCAQIPAFPGALGYGSYATGGRNGTVYHVTTLADSGPGSFRDAVGSANRTVVFDVGGTINLITAVSAKGNLTIAGQTAPGGIKFDGGEISFSGRSNIICRFIRVRPGTDTAASTDDCVAFADGRKMIFDHVSMEFGPWNNVGAVSTAWQTTPVTEITFQHCIDANPTGQQFGAHTESVSSDWTWCYNIFANSHNRNPLAKVNTVFINNLEYNNSAGYTTHTSTKFKHDIVNNYFIAGPASGGNFPWYQIDNNQSMYFTGNLYDSDKNGVLGGGTTVPLPGYQGGGTILGSPWSPWTSIIPTMSPQLAWRYGLSAAGAFPRDEVDALVISQMKTLGSGTAGTGTGTTGPGGSLYTSQTQTGLGNNGYGTIVGLSAPTDTDNDGMPDYWELATGSSTNVANPLTNTITGYTLVENYLNFLAAPHAVTRTNTPVTINLRQFTEGFAASATFSLTNATNGTISLLNGTNAVFTPTANFTGLGVFTFIVTEGTYSVRAVTTVCVTPITPPASAAAFNGVLIGVSIASAAVPLPANLLWHGDGTANAWNTTASNWLNGSALAKFKDNDVVTFDDTGSSAPAITLSGALSPRAMLFDTDKSYTLAGSGSFSGSGSLSKTGTGTVTIGTTNSSFTGPITISDGVLALVSGASLGSGAISLASGGTLNVLGGGSGSTVSGAISVPNGDHATIASGQLATGFTGALTTAAKSTVLNVSNSVSFNGTASSQFSGFYGTIKILPNSTLRFYSSGAGNTFGSLNPSFVVNGKMQPRIAGNIIRLGSISGSGQLTGQEKPVDQGGSGYVTYDIGGNNTDSIFTGSIIDAFSTTNPTCLVKSGIGRLTLTGTNTFTGTNAVLAGAQIVSGINTPSLTTVFSNATLGGAGVITGPIVVKSAGILSPGTDGVGTLTFSNNVTLNGSAVLNFDLSSSPDGANDMIAMPGGLLTMGNPQVCNFNLVNNTLGAGTYYLISGGTNTSAAGVGFSTNLPGNTRQTFAIERPSSGNGQCYVRLAVTGAAASLVWCGTNGVNWDTVTTNWANNSNPDAYYNLDTVTFDNTGANPSNVMLAATLTPAAITVDSWRNYTFGGNGALAGNGPLTKSGSGALTIGTSNSAYTGPLRLYGGTLVAATAGALGNGSLTISNGATLSMPSNAAVIFGGPVTIPANAAAAISSGDFGNGLAGKLYSGNRSSRLDLCGTVSFSGDSSAQFDNFTGTINLPSGATLLYSASGTNNTLGSLATTLVINGTLRPRNAGNTVQIGAFSGVGELAGPQSTNGTGDTLYVIGGNHSDSVFSGVISSNSAVAGSEVSLTKTGTGALTLNGASTYTGGTTVEGGTLCVNNVTGSATGSGAVEVFSRAILTGSGIIGGAATIDGGATLAPGGPLGTLTFNDNLTLNDSSILQFALGTNSDLVAVAGSLFLTGQLEVTNAPGFGAGTYTLFTCGGTLTFDNLVLQSAPAGYIYSFNTNTPGAVKLVVTPIAPPSFDSITMVGSQVVMTGSGGMSGANYYVLSTTNLATGLPGWIWLATNQFDNHGNFAWTNMPAPSSPQQFYRLFCP